jgi:hypothetical protein
MMSGRGNNNNNNKKKIDSLDFKADEFRTKFDNIDNR